MRDIRGTQEIRSLTGLRGVAAIYVVIFHFLSGIPLTTPFHVFLAHGYLSVDLFFVLSGFVMTLNYAELFLEGGSVRSSRTFLGRRIARVYPLYSVATLSAAALIASGRLDWLSGQPLRIAIPLNLAMVQAWGFGQSLDSPGWSISAEWAAYLLFPFALRLVYSGSPNWARFAATSSVGAIFAPCTLPASVIHRSAPLLLLDIADPYAAVPIMRCLPEFLLGTFSARLLRQKQAAWLYAERLVPEGICLAILLLAARPASDFFVVLLFPPLILSLTSPSSLPGRLLAGGLAHHFGELSYSIYLVHDLFGRLLAKIHTVANLHGLRHGQSVAIAVVLPAIYLASLAAFHGIERPGRRVLRKLFEGRASESPREAESWGHPS